MELDPQVVRDNEQAILDWCEDSDIPVGHVHLPGFISIYEPVFYTYWFASIEDAIAFKLRWI